MESIERTQHGKRGLNSLHTYLQITFSNNSSHSKCLETKNILFFYQLSVSKILTQIGYWPIPSIWLLTFFLPFLFPKRSRFCLEDGRTMSNRRSPIRLIKQKQITYDEGVLCLYLSPLPLNVAPEAQKRSHFISNMLILSF